MEPKTLYYIVVKDSKGNSLPNIPVSLRYKFSEDEDDVCEIELESADRRLADNKAYKGGNELTVYWGWINGTQSNKRKVYIFDQQPEYKQDGRVNLKLICYDRFAVGKMDSAVNQNLSQLKNNSPIVFSSNVIKNVKLEIEKGNTELKSLIDSNNFNLGKTATPYNKDSRVVSTYNGNMSTYQNLRKILDRLPGGPYVMDSRDDLLLIRTRDFSKSSRKSFTWKGGSGELKDFKPITKNRSTKASATQVSLSTYDPETKTATNVTAKSGNTNQVKLANGNVIDIYLDGTLSQAYNKIAHPPKDGLKYVPRATDRLFTSADIHGALIRDKQQKELDKKNRILNINGGKPSVMLQTIRKNLDDPNFKRSNPYNDFSNKEVDKGLIVKRGIKQGNPNITYNELYLGTDNGKTYDGGNSRDNTAVARNNFALVTDQTSINKAAMSNDTKEKAAAHAENLQKDAELENNPATASLIGQPEIEVGQIITILGVANKDSGNYYISECEHVLKDDVYDLELGKLLRQGINGTIVGNYTKSKKKGKKVDLYSLIPNNPNLSPKTPTQVINRSAGQSDSNLKNVKKVGIKTPAKS